MPGRDVVVVSTGVANLASMMAGLHRAGGNPYVTSNVDEIRNADHVVLPGVGAFAAAMERLEKTGLTNVLTERLRSGRATLAVCLGFQLLCLDSEEDPSVHGLGVLPQRVLRFPPSVSCPQFGWNYVLPGPGCRFLSEGYAYFANSYRLATAPPEWNCAVAEHGGPFIAAIEKDAILACQFHPELSGMWGIELMSRWLNTAPPGVNSSC